MVAYFIERVQVISFIDRSDDGPTSGARSGPWWSWFPGNVIANSSASWLRFPVHR